jgi:hypothetical protein
MDDIIIKGDYDNSINERVFIIHGEDEMEGKLDIVSNLEKDNSYFHFVYLNEYVKIKYKHDLELQYLANNGYYPDTIIYLLVKKYNDIIFKDTTKDHEKNRYGIFFLPDSISENQLDSLEILKEYVKDFKEYLVISKLRLEDNRIDEVNSIISDIKQLNQFINVRKNNKMPLI